MGIHVADHPHPMVARRLYTACLEGRLPAEVLPTALRERLVRALHRRGWTDPEIATYTCMTTYTTARIRQRLALRPNRSEMGVA